MTDKPSVCVIGGGVAGLTAAHELAERGFRVDVYEPRAAWGGKARSQPVAGTGKSGRMDLPGEHGFRFYPRFYRHVIDTMQRIPLGAGHVADRLCATTEAAIALIDTTTWFRFFHRAFEQPNDVVDAISLFFRDLGFDNGDVGLFVAKILQFFTSSDERRAGAYEQLSWWDFLEADNSSPQFQRQLRAIPRMMVAMDAKRGSANTVGTISMQLLLDYATTGVTNDRTLRGPTTEMWIDPWIAQLKTLGVTLHGGVAATALQLDPARDRLTGVTLADGTVATADYYVLAVPIEAAIPLLAPVATRDPMIARLTAKRPEDLVSWMNGIQFYLYEDVPIVRGHVFYPDSPWALTSISQAQFWRELGLFRRRYGDGEVGGCLSVDISEWDTPGTFVPKTAKQCTRDEIAHEVWAQLKAALNGAAEGEEILTDDLLHSWHIDDDLEFGGPELVNHARLLVHPPGSWAFRPTAATAIDNLVLAADYVRTMTNIASMEGANEAARTAVNAILSRAGTGAKPAELWPLVEPETFAAWKALDRRLYEHGKPHLFELLGIRQAAQAADVLRRFSAFTGLSRAGDLLDDVTSSGVVTRLLSRLGLTVE